MSSITPERRPLGKSYEPELFENDVYQFWEANGCFEASDKNGPGQESFCIVIPPPNVTGALHMGHALTNTIQDILVRWRRMKGDNTLWLPGTDHAGIATQTQVEKQIAKEGKGPSGRPLTRHDLGREEFLNRVWKWKDEQGGQIKHQLRKLGSSLDWQRERFTMDAGLSQAVREVFVRLYDEKLIYRGERLINWCPRCQTALSDLEVEPQERKGYLWHIVYKIVNDDVTPAKNPDGLEAQLVIATTRPETLLGDTAVAVHPEDERYLHLHGKKAILPILGRLIPIITDEYVDREFGSGALKITPAHDFNDYELGKKHGLPFVTVMGKDGRITSAGGPYSGLKFGEAREEVTARLKEEGLLIKTVDHPHRVGLCQRCDTVAEPILSKQWFVKIEPLAKPAIEAVETGKIVFSPKTWEKTYFEWMHNIRDWCISRQLWWGHQIPAWYCGRCQEVTVARQSPEKCGKCGAPPSELKQDEDVLDTWFSSALWPFSTLGWPENTPALKTFYPTSILETGFDIIFFWVARMIMMGMHFMNEVPFNRVYLHAMVRDEKGEKMSKTKGNVIDPLDLIRKHGADPLRLTLAAMAGQGRDIKLSADRVEGYRAFCNKLWNAVKFFHLQVEACGGLEAIGTPAGDVHAYLQNNHTQLSTADRWILSRLQSTIETVEAGLEKFELNEAANALYSFVWFEFCDWFVEFAKLEVREEDFNDRRNAVYTLHHVLETSLKLLHPFIPHVTEELWQSMPWIRAATNHAREGTGKPPIFTLMLQPFPRTTKAFFDIESERAISAVRNVVEAIRNFRGENNISPKVEFAVRYCPAIKSGEAFVGLYRPMICALARVSGLERINKGATAAAEGEGMEAVIPLAIPPLELRVSLKGLVNVEEERRRLQKEIDKLNEDIAFVARKLAQETFIAKAPPDLVAKERKKEQDLRAKAGELDAALLRLTHLAETT